MRRNFDPPSEPPDGDPVCRICDYVMIYNPLVSAWECVQDHDALDEEPDTLRIRPQIGILYKGTSLKP